MKHIATLFFLLIYCHAFAQELNYCNYFFLDVSERDYGAKKVKAYNPSVKDDISDKFSIFLHEHKNRFEYILFKNAQGLQEAANFFPDTNKINDIFCRKIMNAPKMQKYFKALCPNNLVVWDIRSDTFTLDEIMLVASHFFYCDAINKKDTAIQSHVCIGINGQHEMQSQKDFTLLEAFTFEAIFSHINKKKEPLFYKEFQEYKNRIAKEKRKDFVDFDSYLIEIKNACYHKMKMNKDLKKKLLKYYAKNKVNLNFAIQ